MKPKMNEQLVVNKHAFDSKRQSPAQNGRHVHHNIDGRDLVMEQVDPTGCRVGNKFTSRPNLTYTQNKSIARVSKFLPTFLGGRSPPYKSAAGGLYSAFQWVIPTTCQL